MILFLTTSRHFCGGKCDEGDPDIHRCTLGIMSTRVVCLPYAYFTHAVSWLWTVSRKSFLRFVRFAQAGNCSSKHYIFFPCVYTSLYGIFGNNASVRLCHETISCGMENFSGKNWQMVQRLKGGHQETRSYAIARGNGGQRAKRRVREGQRCSRRNADIESITLL